MLTGNCLFIYACLSQRKNLADRSDASYIYREDLKLILGKLYTKTVEIDKLPSLVTDG